MIAQLENLPIFFNIQPRLKEFSKSSMEIDPQQQYNQPAKLAANQTPQQYIQLAIISMLVYQLPLKHNLEDNIA